MANNPEFYKGRKKRKNYAVIPAGILAGIIAIVIVLFYGMQKYAVITKDDVSVQFAGINEKQTTTDATGTVVEVFPEVNATIVFEQPDYSSTQQTVQGTNVPELRGIFVPYNELDRTHLEEYAARLNRGNALILEMKGKDGYPMWNSTGELIRAYGLYNLNPNATELTTVITELKEKNVYLVAQISCCLDNLMAAYSTTVPLKAAGGALVKDEDGYTWLDPYNVSLRNYVVDMCNELYDLGFDEVVLANVVHPVLEEGQELLYSRQMSGSATPTYAVCGFAQYVAEQLKDRDGFLSIYVDSAIALAKNDTSNGQDAEFFLKLYDRVYYKTDRYAYTFNLSDIERVIHTGNVEQRFVPVVINYLPDGDCWVLIDQDEN